MHKKVNFAKVVVETVICALPKGKGWGGEGVLSTEGIFGPMTCLKIGVVCSLT